MTITRGHGAETLRGTAMHPVRTSAAAAVSAIAPRPRPNGDGNRVCNLTA